MRTNTLYGDDICVADIYWRNRDPLIASIDWPPNALDLLDKTAYLAISLCVGLLIVGPLLANAKKEQWRTVRLMTYKQIVYHLCNIVMSLSNENVSLISESDSKLATIVDGFTHINKDIVAGAVKAYQDLSGELRSTLEDKNKELEGLENEEQWNVVYQLLSNMYDDISRPLDLIRLVLIPRVLCYQITRKYVEF